MSTPRPPRTRLRVRLAALSAATLGALVGLLVAAGQLTPAQADVPVGFSDPDKVNVLHAFLLIGGVPLVLALIIVAAVYAPSLARGESISPVHTTTPVADQWLGGPRRGTAELAAPDSDDSHAGGARGSW